MRHVWLIGHILPGQDASRIVIYTVAGAARPRPAERESGRIAVEPKAR